MYAIRAALSIQESVAQLHQELPKSSHLHIGIGIATGEAVVGNIGTAQLMNYTALGSCVNVARRLQEIARGGQTLLNGPLYEVVKSNIRANPLGLTQLKGLFIPEPVYELVGLA